MGALWGRSEVNEILCEESNVEYSAHPAQGKIVEAASVQSQSRREHSLVQPLQTWSIGRATQKSDPK